MLLPSLIVFTTLASSAAAHTANKAKRNHITVPLNQHQGKIDLIKHTIHAAAKHSGGRGRHRFALEPETLDAGFWYGVFNVGEAHNLSLLIDTGSPDVAVNPGLYKPSRASRNLSEAGSLEYGTVEENGCGAANISYQAYTDYVSQAGLVARNQTFGNVIPNPAPVVAGTITSFPYVKHRVEPLSRQCVLMSFAFRHDGIVGFGVPPANETQIGGTPFFQDLCNQGAVRECRFGLAFQTSGKGTQVLGGLDHALVSGELSRANSNADWDTTGSVAINGTTLLLQNETFLLDSGTANVRTPQNRRYLQECQFQLTDTQDRRSTSPGPSALQRSRPPNCRAESPRLHIRSLRLLPMRLATNGRLPDWQRKADLQH